MVFDVRLSSHTHVVLPVPSTIRPCIKGDILELTNTVASTAIVPLALTGAIMYTFWNQLLIGYTAQGAFQRPIVCGFFFGLVSGRMEECMILSAGIESLYLGLVTPGGNTPTDYMAAACVGIPVWLCTEGMTSTQAVALAVPVGLLFALVTIVKYIICGFFVEPAEKYAEEANTRGIFMCAVVWPALVKAILGFTLMFLSIYLGSTFVQGLLDALPDWLTHGFEIAGGILPALGFGLTIMIIGRPTYIPLFLIGYFMVQYGGLSVMACAIFAICICLFITFFRIDLAEQLADDDDDWGDDDEEEQESTQRVLTTADVNGFFMRWWVYCEMPHSYQRMQALALCSAMIPSLKKLYPGEENKEKLASALHRELMYFNTQGIWGSSALGVALAMEEEQAITQAMSEEDATASINGLKIGFMGPFAGVGDTIDWGILLYLLIGIGLPACSDGNPVGILPVLIGFPAITIAEGLFFTNLGYRLGRTALGQLFSSGMIDRLIECASMIGMMMMGSLGNTYVSLTLASEDAQATLDSIIPGLLPLIAIFLVYFVLQRVTQQMQYISVGLIIVGLLLALVGIC